MGLRVGGVAVGSLILLGSSLSQQSRPTNLEPYASPGLSECEHRNLERSPKAPKLHALNATPYEAATGTEGIKKNPREAPMSGGRPESLVPKFSFVDSISERPTSSCSVEIRRSR